MGNYSLILNFKTMTREQFEGEVLTPRNIVLLILVAMAIGSAAGYDLVIHLLK